MSIAVLFAHSMSFVYIVTIKHLLQQREEDSSMVDVNHEITYHNLDSSPALNEDINKRLKKLERLSSDITHIRVVLDSPHNHKHKGKLFHVAIEISVKGNSIVSSYSGDCEITNAVFRSVISPCSLICPILNLDKRAIVSAAENSLHTRLGINPFPPSLLLITFI